MTINQLLARTKAHVGKGFYRMGAGAQSPTAQSPFDESGAADCSAAVCWALGLKKYQPQLAWLVKVNGGWLNTNGIYWDATTERTGWFEQIPKPEVGCVVVYPSKSLAGYASVGHVGIIVGPHQVWHCSSGNYRSTGGAIQVTDLTVFHRQKATIYALCATIE